MALISSYDFLEGNIAKTLFKAASTMTLGVFSVIFFTLLDTYFVAQLGNTALIALSMTVPVVFFVFSAAFGLSTGAMVVTARLIGAKDTKMLQGYIGNALIFSVLLGIGLVCIGFATCRLFFQKMGAFGEIEQYILSYMSIWYISVPLLTFAIVGNGILRAFGDAGSASTIMILTSLVNVALDPLLIFGVFGFFSLGIQGAAWASVITRVVSSILTLYFLIRKNLLTFKKGILRRSTKFLREIIDISSVAMISYLSIPLSDILVTILLGKQNVEAVAAFGIGSRIESFTFIPIIGLGSVLGPFIAQNLGAKRNERVQKGFWGSIGFICIFGVFLGTLLHGHGAFITGFFTKDAAAVRYAIEYITWIATSYGFSAISFIVATFFMAVKRPKIALTITAIRLFIFRLPSVYLVIERCDIMRAFTAIGICNIASGLVALFVVKMMARPYFSESTSR